MAKTEDVGRRSLGTLLEELGADGLTVQNGKNVTARDEVWDLFKNAVSGAVMELQGERRMPRGR